MLAQQRQVRILTELRRNGAVRVSDLIGLLGVSDMTVRRDLEQLAAEGAPHGIRVNSLHPGRISTPATDAMPVDLIPIPLGRPGQPEEVASFVVFLASDESSFATGSEFTMDGGTVTAIPTKV